LQFIRCRRRRLWKRPRTGNKRLTIAVLGHLESAIGHQRWSTDAHCSSALPPTLTVDAGRWHSSSVPKAEVRGSGKRLGNSPLHRMPPRAGLAIVLRPVGRTRSTIRRPSSNGRSVPTLS
jgi:hypothetical protein